MEFFNEKNGLFHPENLSDFLMDFSIFYIDLYGPNNLKNRKLNFLSSR